jgi:hypothetical protein
MEKRKIWNENKYVYQINNSIYLTEDKRLIYITRNPTDKESDGFWEYAEPDWLELVSYEEDSDGNDTSEVMVIEHTYYVKEFLEIMEELKQFIGGQK